MIVAPALIDLGIILMFLVGFALCLLARQFVRALFQSAESSVGWIPWLGSRVVGDLHRIEQRFTNYIGGVAAGLEHRAGSWFHSLVGIVEATGSALEHAFELIYKQAAHAALYVGKEIYTHVKTIEKTVVVVHDVAIHATKTADHAIARAIAIPADVLRQGDLAGLRGQARAAEDEIRRLWEWARAHGRTVVEGAAVGTIAYAVGKLGMTWARCSNWQKIGKRGCGLDPSLLESLLADTLLIVGSISIVELARDCQAITGTAESAIKSFVREF